MSAMDVRLGGRRETANAADRRKKMILIGLGVVLLVLVAFQLMRMTKGSDASSAAPAASSTVQPAVAGSTGTISRSAPSATASAARLRAIGRLNRKDPFVPLIRANAGTPTAAPAASQTRSRRSGKPAARARIRHARAAVRPRVIKPAAPTAAVIWTNGRPQTVGIGQKFSVGDTTFRVTAVTRKAMRLRAVGGAFASGKRTIKVRKGHAITLVNVATGIKYSVRFTAGTTAPPTVTQSETQPSQSTVPNAAPSAGTAIPTP